MNYYNKKTLPKNRGSFIVPHVIASGTLDPDEYDDPPGYFIMPRLDVDLTTYLEKYSGVEKS